MSTEDLVKSFAKLFVPEEILLHFEVTELKQEGKYIFISLEEKNDVGHIPKSILNKGKAVLNGFYNKIDLQTYPAQGKEVFLRLYRRRWKLKGTTQSYGNEYDFAIEGTKATKEFGSFLKSIGR